MTTLKKRFTLVFGLIIATMVRLAAQDFQGVAYYQSARKMNNFQIQGDGMTPAMQEQFQAQMKKQFQREYQLTFNLTESVWKEEKLRWWGCNDTSRRHDDKNVNRWWLDL